MAKWPERWSGSQSHRGSSPRTPWSTALWSPLLAVLAAPSGRKGDSYVTVLRPRPNLLGPRKGSDWVSASSSILAHHTVYLHLAKHHEAWQTHDQFTEWAERLPHILCSSKAQKAQGTSQEWPSSHIQHLIMAHEGLYFFISASAAPSHLSSQQEWAR